LVGAERSEREILLAPLDQLLVVVSAADPGLGGAAPKPRDATTPASKVQNRRGLIERVRLAGDLTNGFHAECTASQEPIDIYGARNKESEMRWRYGEAVWSAICAESQVGQRHHRIGPRQRLI
jgi:hypothetical protein